MNTRYTDEEQTAPETPGFDDLGRPVPVTFNPVAPEPTGEAVSGMDPEQLLTILLTGAATVKDAGEHAVLVGYVCREFVPTAPQTLRELGQRLGCSHVMAGRRVNRFLADLRKEYAHLAFRS